MIEHKKNWTVSFIPLTPKVTNVTIEGCQYPLKNYDLEWGYSLTVSNIIIEDKAIFTFDEGEIVVILTRENGLN